ncbi:hypothetical protein MMC28_007727 [Mycoblastus sanguinarius]|nr:hypothetical protein [Mycoblastus sanguinarius]
MAALSPLQMQQLEDIQPKTITPPEPITLPEPIIPLQPVIAVEQPVTPPEPSSIEKEKENIVTSKPDPASSADLCKLQTPRQSTQSARFTPAPAPAFKLSFSAMIPYQQATFASPLAYTRHAEEMEATSQG